MKLEHNLFTAEGYLNEEAKEFMRSRGIRSAENLLSRSKATATAYYYSTKLIAPEPEEEEKHPFDRDDLTISGHMAMVLNDIN